MIGKICEHTTEFGGVELFHKVNFNGVEIWTVRFQHKELGLHIMNYVFYEQAVTKYNEYYNILYPRTTVQ